MSNLLYVSLHDLKKSKDGVSKKINSQIKAFNQNGIITEYIYRNDEGIFCNTEEGIIATENIKGRKGVNSLYKNIEKYQYSYIYIRYESTTFQKIKKIKKWKKHGSKVLIEIPTYPYRGEKHTLYQKIIYFYKEIYNLMLRKHVDYIVTFSDDQEIWGIPCINISNGIDLENTKLINKVEDATITFTSVSICAQWHGIDRFLNSLETYLEQNSSVQVKFNIVGEGVETEKLKQIVNDSKYLSDVVIFRGFQSGEELDEIYNETDIAVGSLGRHRSGLTSLKTLKNREYAAKGLPMIYSEIDTDFENKPFVYKVTPDEALIDLDKVIAWHQNLKMQPEAIREYAKQFSWDTQMKKVIDAIEEN